MSKPSDTSRSLLHRLGVAGPARVRAYPGIGASLLSVLVILALAPAARANSAEGYARALGLGPGEGAEHLELAAPFIAGPDHGEGGIREGSAALAGSGVAVNDATHDVYVADTGNRRVDEFGPTGEFIRAFGAKVEPLGGDECTKMTGCQKGAVGASPGELSGELAQPRFVAVDNAPGASRGDVYVGDGVGREASDEVQYVEFANAEEGTYTLSFDGETTEPIQFKKEEEHKVVGGTPEEDRKAAQAALEQLPAIGKGNFTVLAEQVTNLGGSHNNLVAGLLIRFEGALAETAVPELACDPAGLVPAGASCPVSISREAARFAVEGITKFNEEGKLEEGWGEKGRLTGSSGPVQVASGTGELTAGSQTVTTSVSTDKGDWGYGAAEHEPLEISGEGIPAGTLVTSASSVNYLGEEVLQISQAATKTGSVALTAHGRYQFGGRFEGLTVNSAGDVLALALEKLYEFEPNGALGPNAEFVAVRNGAGSASGVAVNSAGDIYTVSEASGGSGHVATEISPTGQALRAVSPEHEPAPSGLGLDSAAGGGLYLALGGLVEDASTGGTFGSPQLRGSAGVAVDSSVGDPPLSGAVYVANTVEDKVDVNAVLLEAETTAASGETASGMVLSGEVDPEGSKIEECYFEYGTSTSYGQVAQCEPGAEGIGVWYRRGPCACEARGPAWRYCVSFPSGHAEGLDDGDRERRAGEHLDGAGALG